MFQIRFLSTAAGSFSIAEIGVPLSLSEQEHGHIKLKELTIFVALAVGGCIVDSDETASLNTESNVLLHSSMPMEGFTCDLRVSCKDAVKIEQSANALPECNALEQKSHTFDTGECEVMFVRGTEFLRDIKVSVPLR